MEGVLIGRLYREVHFCFPKYDAGLGSSLAEAYGRGKSVTG